MKIIRSAVFYLTTGMVMVLLTTFTSCEEKLFTEDVDCNECYQIKPDSANVIINLTFDDDYTSIPFILYNGKVGENNIEYIDTAYGSPHYVFSPVNKYYSIEAEYNKDGKKIIAVDGDKLVVKHVSGVCDRDCWVIEGGVLKVELKN